MRCGRKGDSVRLYGLAGHALVARVDAVMAQLGLEQVADRATMGFSQGERVKVALGSAPVHNPTASASAGSASQTSTPSTAQLMITSGREAVTERITAARSVMSSA